MKRAYAPTVRNVGNSGSRATLRNTEMASSKRSPSKRGSSATAEISRSQVWQWLHDNTVTAEGTRIDQTSIVRIMAAAVAELPRFEGDRFDDAISVFRTVALEPEFPTFLTVGAYARFL